MEISKDWWWFSRIKMRHFCVFKTVCSWSRMMIPTLFPIHNTKSDWRDIKNPEVMRNDARSGQVSWLFVAMTFLIESREETDTEGNTILLLRGEILPGSSSSAHICTVMMRYRFDVCLFDLLCCKQHIKDCKGGTDSSLLILLDLREFLGLGHCVHAKIGHLNFAPKSPKFWIFKYCDNMTWLRNWWHFATKDLRIREQ